MADVARLGLVVDANGAISQIRLTQGELDRLSASGARAQASLKQSVPAELGARLASVTRETANLQAITSATEPVLNEHTLNIGRLSRSLETFVVRGIGANEQLGLMAAAFGHAEIGGTAVIGVLAGIAAAVFVWDAWTEKTREAKKEQNELTDALEKWYAKEREGAAGDFPKQIDAEIKKIKELHKALDDMGSGSFFTKTVATLSQVGGAKGWLRILTSALGGEGWSQLATEIAQGTAKTVQQIDDGGGAIAAATKEAAKRVKDAEKQAFDERMAAAKAYYAEANRLRAEAAAALKPLVDKFDEGVKKKSDAIDAANKLAEDQFYEDIKRTEEQHKKEEELQKESLKRQSDEYTRFFRGIIDNGIKKFSDLFDYIKSGFARLIADMASKQLGQAMSGFIGTAAVGGTAATGAGGSILGGLGAAVTAHPFVAAAVGAVALGSALFSLSDSAKEAKQRMDELRVTFYADIAAVRALVGVGTTLAQQLADNKKNFDDLRKEAAGLVDVLNRNTFTEYKKNIDELNALEKKRADQLALQAAQQAVFDQKDLQARALTAFGRKEEADDLAFVTAQQKEYTQAVNDHKDATYLATLAEVQAAESTARSIEKVKTTIAGLDSTISGLQSFKDSLALSSTVSPTDRLAEAQRQYDAIVKSAQGGDQGAAGRLPAAAQTLLDAAQAVYASGPAFQAIYNKINADTDAIIKFYQDQRSIAQQQLDQLKQIAHFQELLYEGIGRTDKTGGGINGGIKPFVVAGADSSAVNIGTNTLIAVSADGFNQLVTEMRALRKEVADNTQATKNGFEGVSLT